MIDAIIARPRDGGHRHAGLGDQAGARRDDEPVRRRLPRPGGPREGARDRQAPEGGGRKSAYIDDRGTVFNQDVLGAIELGYMLDCAEAIVVAAIERKESAAPSSAPTSPSATTRSGSSTSTSRLNGDGPRCQLLAGDDHPVAARGEEILMAETHRPAGAVHPADAPLRPRVGRGALLGRAHDRARAPPLGAGGDSAGQGQVRRLDRHPLLLPGGDLRLLRRAHQRRTGACLPHPSGPRQGAAPRMA